jgi:hypothetical protein
MESIGFVRVLLQHLAVEQLGLRQISAPMSLNGGRESRRRLPGSRVVHNAIILVTHKSISHKKHKKSQKQIPIFKQSSGIL